MTELAPPKTVGGGVKKVLYTLSTINRIGLTKAAKALKANNACKACGLGMGGQMGGMTNELGEFPSFCNKSVQAQSTDIQAEIPEELFNKHPVSDFKELTGKEIEHLGRLNFPIYKAKHSSHYQRISWAKAIEIAAEKMKSVDPSRSFFYSSGRSSNEAGFLLQLIARLYGTNNVNNCSYYCHQATGVALNKTIGTGTATIELEDLTGCDLFFLIGANPASNHPRLIHQLHALRDRGGHVVVINPAREPGLVKFAVPKSPKSLILGGSDIASEYLQPSIGSDVYILKGIAKAVIESGNENNAFIQQYTEQFEDYAENIKALSWQEITQSCGIEKTQIERIANLYCKSENVVFAWGMGITHHLNGVDNIEAISNLALLRGMLGKKNAGLLPLRGHSNIQGIGSVGVKPILPEDIFSALENNLGVELPRTPGKDTLACLTSAKDQEMDFALLMGGNLYSASPDLTWTEQALDSIDTKVFLTTTLNHGHVFGMDNSEALVLPVTARDEEWEPTTQESMFNFLRLSDGGINRLDGVLPETEILSRLAEHVITNSPINFREFRKHQNLRAAIAHSMPGMEGLTSIAETKKEFHLTNRVLHNPEFNTASGKARFTIQANPTLSKISEFPFRLMTVRSEGQFNSIVYEETDSYRDTKNRWCVLLNPKDIHTLNINETSQVNLKSPNGEMTDVTVYPFDIPCGNAMAYYPEANVLVGRSVDPQSKTPAFKNIDIAIEVVPKSNERSN